MQEDNDILVSVLVLTYNQENTIERTLKSILSQKTSYYYEIVISDDDSNDSTYLICKKYASTNDNVKLLDKHPNMGVVKNYFYTLQQAKGEYIMGCAGDDWWHNEYKIQKQIDLMLNNPSVSLCYGGVNYFNTVTCHNSSSKMVVGDLNIERLLVYNPIAAVTICYRRNCLPANFQNEVLLNNFGMEDYPIILTAAYVGRIIAINEDLASYSVLPSSTSNSVTLDGKEEFENNVKKVRLYYARKFGLIDKMYTKIMDSYRLSLAVNGIRYNNRNYCVKYLKEIKNKRFSDYVKFVLCYLPGGFMCLRYIMRNIIVK